MANELEPWLTGTHSEVNPVLRAVLHALELAERDVARWSFRLDEEELRLQPYGLPSVSFQVRHIARSMDRLLTYAEGRPLTTQQLAALAAENEEPGLGQELRTEFQQAMRTSVERLLRFPPEQFDKTRYVGRENLTTTVAGLLIHLAEHTQRHVGQAITTAKLVTSLRGAEQS